MASSREERVRAIFDEIADAPAPERAGLLDALCAGDEELRREIAALVHHLGPESVNGEVDGFVDCAPRSRIARAPVPGGDTILLPGERVADCVVEELLQRGGSSEVYRALRGRERVALKVVPLLSISAGERARIEDGARMVASIRHPHLAEIHDCGVTEAGEGLLTFTMRLIEGPTLQDVLSALADQVEPLRGECLRALVERIAEVAGALGALHAAGIVHRDVKPANVVLEGGHEGRELDGRAVLVDYGLVRRSDDTILHSAIWATPAYAAPEVLFEGRADARTDVYALGLCLADLVAARIPEEGRNLRASHEPLRRTVPDVDRRLEAIVDRACDPLPERRYDDADALARDLRAWLAGGALAVRPLSHWTLARRWMQRHPSLVLRGLAYAGAALLLAAAAGAATLVVTHLVRDSRTAHAAWSEGHIGRAREHAEELPSLLRGFLVPAALDRALTSAFTRAEDALNDVLDTEKQHGVGAATLLAARYVERDGVRAHPELVLFLASGVHALDGEDPAREVVILALSRLFFDRALDRPIEFAGARCIRRKLFDALRALGDEPDVEAHAVCAIGGCGDADTLSSMLVWTTDRFRAYDGDRALFVQALRALELLVRRSHAGRYRPALLQEDWQSWLDRIGRLTLGDGDDAEVTSAFEDLLVAVAVVLRAEGAQPLDADRLAAYAPRELLLRAASGELVLDDRDALACAAKLEPGAADALSTLALFGRAAGLHGDEAIVERAFRAALAFLPPGYPHADARAYFTHSVLDACNEREGVRGEHLPDPDTRLGAWFALREAELEPIDATLGDPGANLAGWCFLSAAARLRGRARGVCGRGVVLETDDPRNPDDGFAKLGVADHSELGLHFVWRRDVPPLELCILAQKGARWGFPNAGEVRFAVELDGEPVAGNWRIIDAASGRWTAPIGLRDAGPDGEHVLTIRLLASSTTTMRVYGVEIRPR